MSAKSKYLREWKAWKPTELIVLTKADVMPKKDLHRQALLKFPVSQLAVA
jgi:hypothetical protein